MENICRELAGTGLSMHHVALLALVIIVGSVLLLTISRRRGFLAPLLMIIGILGIAAYPAANLSAQSVNDPCEEPSVSTPPVDSENFVVALDDGPYYISNDIDNVIEIPILSNDSPGSSNFNHDTIDLDPSTPQIDYNFYYSDGTNSGDFILISERGTVLFKPESTPVVGSTIRTPYTVNTVDGELAGPADIIIEIVEWIAQGDVMNICGFNVESNTLITNNDSHPSGIDPSTVDLDPATPGQQTTHTSPDGKITYVVESNGMLIATLPTGGMGVPENVDGTYIAYYTVEANDGTISNPAPISFNYVIDCGQS